MDWFARQADERSAPARVCWRASISPLPIPPVQPSAWRARPMRWICGASSASPLKTAMTMPTTVSNWAGRINRQAFADGHVFWGLPSNQTIDGLTHRKPPARSDNLGRKRLAEARAKGAQSVWQLY